MRTVTRCAVWLLCLLLLPCPLAAEADADAPAIRAEAAVLLEAGSGRVLFAQNADASLPMASTTKIMTALLAIESGRLSEPVTVSETAARTEGSSLYLKADETQPLIDLVYGLMLQSGNDAAVAIAEHLSGSVEAFAERMNEKAAALQLDGTHFVNPNGLHDSEHYTTAKSLARLAAFAMQNETFRAVVSAVRHVTDGGSVRRVFRNKNRMLTEYDGCTGIKTGYTKAAGKCLVFSAKRNGMELIGVLLNDPAMWDDAKALLDYGFSAYELRSAAGAFEVFTVNVLHGEKNALPAAPKHDILYPIRTDGSESLSIETSLYGEVSAPMEAGDPVGRITVYVNGEAVCEVPVTALETVRKKSLLRCIERILCGMS